jgi:xylulose-5-phosphate/fructose-6-phosphate phosphoketolase
MADERLRHRAYTREVGDDPADVRAWVWPFDGAPEDAATQRGEPA